MNREKPGQTITKQTKLVIINYMNTRLQQEYETMVQANRDDVLQNNITVETRWGKEILFFSLQAKLTDEVTHQLQLIQKELQAIEPDALFISEPGTLHISVQHLIPLHTYSNQESIELWDQIKDDCVNALNTISLPALDITFTKPIPMNAAIIMVAEDKNDAMLQLRTSILEKLPLPDTLKDQYIIPIIHTTLARYKTQLTHGEKIVNYCESYDSPIPMHIDTLYLFHEKTFPLIDPELLKEVPLQENI